MTSASHEIRVLYIYFFDLFVWDRVILFHHPRKYHDCQSVNSSTESSRSARQRESRFSSFEQACEWDRKWNKTTWNESKLYTARNFVRVFCIFRLTQTHIHTLVNCNPFHYDEAHKHAWMNGSAWECMCVSECVCAWGKYRRQIYKPVCCNWAFGIARVEKDNVYDHKSGRENDREGESEKERERETALYTRTYHDYVYCIR